MGLANRRVKREWVGPGWPEGREGEGDLVLMSRNGRWRCSVLMPGRYPQAPLSSPQVRSARCPSAWQTWLAGLSCVNAPQAWAQPPGSGANYGAARATGVPSHRRRCCAACRGDAGSPGRPSPAPANVSGPRKVRLESCSPPPGLGAEAFIFPT